MNLNEGDGNVFLNMHERTFENGKKNKKTESSDGHWPQEIIVCNGFEFDGFFLE